jgi:tryptophan-rich sensory protein
MDIHEISKLVMSKGARGVVLGALGARAEDQALPPPWHKQTQLRNREIQMAAFATAVVVAASIVGQIATFPNLVPWYAGLVKPSFNPPNWVFGPVWTTLYALMAISLWRIMRLPAHTSLRQWALGLFFLQVGLNMAWSWLFFGAHNPLLGVIDIVPQLIAILATAALFYRLDRIAGWCLVPLAAWVAFAALLNVAIWQLNG